MSSLTARIQALRSQIADLLADQVGSYQFTKNGEQVLAIAVLPDAKYGYSYPTAGTKVNGTGLEVVIMTPQINGQPLLDGWSNQDRWFIYLRSHKSNGVLYDSVVRLQEHIQNITQVFPIPANESSGQPESVRLTLSDYWHVEFQGG